MAKTHYTQYDSITEAILGFSELARLNGLNAGIKETLEVIEMSNSNIFYQREQYYYALKSIYCCDEEEIETFDQLFDWFWRGADRTAKGKTTFKNQANLQKKSPSSLVMVGEGKQEGKKQESKSVSGANATEQLRKTDFSRLTDLESVLLEEIAEKLWKQMSRRLKRKLKTNRQKGRVNIRKTIRKNLSHGSNLINLYKDNKKVTKQRLVILLDVSGSMDKYSFFLLKFLFALRKHFEQIEAFVFSTRLIRITGYLEEQQLGYALSLLSAAANNWSGGTKIGACLQDFNEKFGKRLLNGKSTVIILSDGLETGSPELLASQLQKIKLRTRQLVWLNPLKGMQGYEPVQRGMQAALPNLDVFKSAHNLDSILELENFLFNV